MHTRTHMERLFLPFTEIKTVDPNTGAFEGYLAIFNTVDRVKDIIKPGAFKKTLADKYSVKDKNQGVLFPILWRHNPDEPIGACYEAFEDNKGLYIRGQLNLNSARGKEAYTGAQMGYLNGLSIGYDPIQWDWDRTSGVRILKEVRLAEGSFTAFPAHPDALVTQVKDTLGLLDLLLEDEGKDTMPDATDDQNGVAGSDHKDAKEGRAIAAARMETLKRCRDTLKEVHDTIHGVIEEATKSVSVAQAAHPATNDGHPYPGHIPSQVGHASDNHMGHQAQLGDRLHMAKENNTDTTYSDPQPGASVARDDAPTGSDSKTAQPGTKDDGDPTAADEDLASRLFADMAATLMLRDMERRFSHAGK